MKLPSANTALVLIDFQPTILGTLAQTDQLIGRVSRLAAVARSAGVIVATVRVALTEAELAAFPPESAMGQRMRALGPKVAPDAAGTQIVSEIGDCDIAVRKIRVGPFLTTDLDHQLRQRDISTLVFAGVHTSGCVLTAVREAHDLDYRIVVAEDGCADPDFAVHELLMRHIFPKQGAVASVAELIDTIR